VVLEGGYDLDALVDGTSVLLEALEGTRARLPASETGDAHRADGVIARVRAAQAPYWNL
jgi:acetoin utilization deacetylase AcuC-like enzyme